MRTVSTTLSLILVMLITVTCRTLKTSESVSTRVDSTVSSHVKAKSDVHTVVIDKSQFSEIAHSQDTSNEVITEVMFSAPDSIGRQHVIKTTTIERNAGKRKSNILLSQKNLKQHFDSIGINDYKYRANVKSGSNIERSEIVKKKTPLWVWLPVGIVAVGLVLLAYLVLKRFRLVK